MKNRIFVGVLALALLLAACGPKQPAAPEHRYAMRGTIISLDAAHHQVMVNMDAIPGYMEGMVMPFQLKAGWAWQVMKPGQGIKATLVVRGNDAWLEDPNFSSAKAAAEWRKGAGPQPGDRVPDFTLVNQDGRRFHLASLKGHVVLLTFIYTRCPLPDFCPLMERNFSAIAREMREHPKLYPPTDLISISFDPAHDTPAVLKKYGQRYVGKDGFRQWQFATASPAEITRMAKYFGFGYQPKGQVIVHTLQTIEIAPDGRYFKNYPGNGWDPAQVITDLQIIRKVGS